MVPQGGKPGAVSSWSPKWGFHQGVLKEGIGMGFHQGKFRREGATCRVPKGWSHRRVHQGCDEEPSVVVPQGGPKGVSRKVDPPGS
jgi:hypothetical protein